MQITVPHRFHIPVMGIAFTIDSPLKVARFGISSTISIIEDNLMEKLREYYYNQIGEPYVPIGLKEKNYRSRRITDYLNLVQRMVSSQVQTMKNSAFEKGSDLVKYFEMLPEENRVKEKFRQWKILPDSEEKKSLEDTLRQKVVPGTIEVNIMTKVDKDQWDKEGNVIPDGSDALTALKAYAESDLDDSSIVFSAGMNPRLFHYMSSFPQFDADENGVFDKKVVIKVSDYRSALIQGKYLAKKGIWVSEFRVESGLNCGGHVFPTEGLLMGPILQEFKERKPELETEIFELYKKALEEKGKPTFATPHPIRITVQGGIGTSEEDQLLHDFYQVESTGWGTPFLLCPEATTVDDNTLSLLKKAQKKDIVRSDVSPLGVPFHYLIGNSAEIERLKRIDEGKPGSPCTEKYLEANTEFTDTPICTASNKYQKLKLAQLETLELSDEEYQRQRDEVLSKECLCIGLSNAAPQKYEVSFLKNLTAVTICPGPNIVNFSDEVSLSAMVDHIYGRKKMSMPADRPHMFVTELRLYIDYLKEEIAKTVAPGRRQIRKWTNFSKHLLEGIDHYKKLAEEKVIGESERFLSDLEKAEMMIKTSILPRIMNVKE